jgi:hypothetical protein
MFTTPKSPTPATPKGALRIANNSEDNISVACLIGSGTLGKPHFAVTSARGLLLEKSNGHS